MKPMPSENVAHPEPLAARPTSFGDVVSAGHKVDFSRNLDAPTFLKAAVWLGKMERTVDEGCPNYLTLVRHTSGGTVERVGKPNQSSNVGQVTITPGTEATIWHSDDVVSVQHFYLDRRAFSWVAHDIGSQRSIHEEPTNLVGIALPCVANAMDHLAKRLVQRQLDPLVSDSWGIALSDLVLRSIGSVRIGMDDKVSSRLRSNGVRNLCDFIEEHLVSALTLNDLSSQAQCSPYHLARSFKAMTGLAPHQYVLERRIARAREMLEINNTSLADIAYAVGFSSQAHMTDVFRKRLGVTPGAYRKETAK